MDHISIDTLQSLATSLNLPFTTQHVLTIAELAPEIVTFTVDDGTIFLKLRVRLAKNSTVKAKLKAIDKICDQFGSLIDNCQVRLCETGDRQVKKQKTEFDLLLKRSWEEMTNCLIHDEFFTTRLVDSWLVPAKNARYEELEIPLHAAVNEAVKMEGISQFYSHQAAAIDLIAQGDDLVLPTATSSGKSLVYQVGIAQKAIMDSDQCFLLIFPTKALAQDQKSRLKNFMSNAGIECDIETFDGDTPSDRRENIRSSTRILLTNPDMLHVAILPHHYLWSRFLKNIRLVIIDEIHYYHGNFGAAFSMVIMRLLRVCKLYGNTELQFIGCSATIYDPVDHFSALIGKNRKVCVACNNSETIAGDGDGSPFGEKLFVVYRTLIHDSLVLQAIKATVFLLAQGVRTLVFAKTRSMCEVLYKEMQIFCAVHAPNLDVSRKVLPYRGGYSPQERRQIERKLFDSQLLAVISTNALEVGVDIGSLDAVVNVGYPSSNASFYQQAGRAGRRGKKSLNILFLDSFNWNDSIYLKKKELIRERGLQRLTMDTNDEAMINIQLNCAAQEIPIAPDDVYFFGEESHYHQACLEYLRHDPVPNVYIPLAKYNSNPAYLHPIRLVPDPVYELINLRNGQLVEEIEKSRVPFTLYPDAIHLHSGKTWKVKMVDHNKLTAACEQVTADYITQAAKAVKLIPIKAKRKIQCEALNRTINVGPITKDVTISGYKKIDPKTKALLQIVKNGPIDSVSQVVFGLWIDIPILTTMSLMDYNNACHTLQHCMLALAPVYVTGASNLSTNCFSSDMDDRRPILMLYDGSGRSGVIDTLLPLISTIIQRSKTLMENCDCEIGCDQCVFIKQCTTNNSNLDRAFGLDLLNALIKEE